MKRARVAASVLMLAAVLPAARAQEISTGPVPAGVVRLLGDRGKAYTGRDRTLLAGTMPEGAFRDKQLKAFDNASGLDFETFAFRPVTRYSADIALARVDALYPASEVVAFQVEESTKLRGFDLEPFVEHNWFTFTRPRPDTADPYEGWRLVSGSDFEVLGAFSAYHMWDDGPVVSERGQRFLMLAHPDLVQRVRPAVALAERALADVQAFWSPVADPRYVILAPSDEGELERTLRLTIDPSKFVAFAVGTARNEDGFRPQGVRMVIQYSHFARYDERGQRDVLEHELIHAVTRPVSGPFVPTWLEEGLAMWGAEQESGLPSVRRGPTPEEFPDDDRFYLGATGAIVNVYNQSQTIVATLEHRFGREGVQRFYTELGKVRLAPGTKEHHVRTALKAATGWTLEEWTSEWRKRVA